MAKGITVRETVQESASQLVDKLSQGSDLYIEVTSVSSSGISRKMRCLVALNLYRFNRDGSKDLVPVIMDVTYLVAGLLKEKLYDNQIRVSGCGMDMTFWLYESVCNALERNGFPDIINTNDKNRKGSI